MGYYFWSYESFCGYIIYLYSFIMVIFFDGENDINLFSIKFLIEFKIYLGVVIEKIFFKF